MQFHHFLIELEKGDQVTETVERRSPLWPSTDTCPGTPASPGSREEKCGRDEPEINVNGDPDRRNERRRGQSASDTDCGGCVTCLCVRTACVTLLSVCLCVWRVYVCVCVCMCVYVCMYVCVCMCVCVYVYMCVCVFTVYCSLLTVYCTK